MLRFCANLSMLFTELPLEQRFAAAKRHGFQAVEIQFPYELPAERIKAILDEQGLRLILFNVPADDLLQGGEGLAAVPEKSERFLEGLQLACDYSLILKPLMVNILPGRCVNPARQNDYLATFLHNLRLAADRLGGIGVTAVFEAINNIDMPGFLINDHAKMLEVFAELAHSNLGLQYDIYHMNRMQQDCAQFLSRHIDKVRHIQFADCPGRGQPGSGTVDFNALFDLLRKLNYCGWVGAEYKPTGNTVDSLSWLQSN